MMEKRLAVLAVLAAMAFNVDAQPDQRRLLWGDTHVHSNNSFDAYLFENYSIKPDDAYRYARGLPVVHPYHRARVQLQTPLDFLVVSDHAEMLGVPRRIFESDPQLLATEFGQRAAELIATGRRGQMFRELLAALNRVPDALAAELTSADFSQPVWQQMIATAERNNDPGRFSALIGWEWSSTPDGANLHRVVMTDGDSDTASRFSPFSSLDSPNPEDLWSWLAETEQKTGAKFVAIPHNMNISNGRMFDSVTYNGEPIDGEWASARLRWEPVVEITQVKGDSETAPSLSPEDEFAAFESYRHLIDTRPGTNHTAPVTPADYVRPAMLRGLEISNSVGVNPYQVGVIGSTDSHTGLAGAEENNFHGKFAADSIPEKKPQQPGNMGPTGWDMSASGLAAVWADDNTRTDIVAAFRRREVYASTGPRIAVRLFGGSAFDEQDAMAADFAVRGYRGGVPMGGELSGLNSAPTFIVRAQRDPATNGLDRIQMVKGWIDATGRSQERVYNIAASGEREPGPDGALNAIEDTVDPATGFYDHDGGAAELVAHWRDPDFDPTQAAFYYVRVLQAPTPRHSLLDEIALQQPGASGHPASIQERAYTSAIWYQP